MKINWKKFTAGCYEATLADGRFLAIRSVSYETEGESSEKAWVTHIWPTEDDQYWKDGYCGHSPTLKIAKAGVLEMLSENKS